MNANRRHALSDALWRWQGWVLCFVLQAVS